jgi:hypothetical protein
MRAFSKNITVVHSTTSPYSNVRIATGPLRPNGPAHTGVIKQCNISPDGIAR